MSDNKPGESPIKPANTNETVSLPVAPTKAEMEKETKAAFPQPPNEDTAAADAAAQREAEREIRRKSRRSFLWAAGIAAGVGFGIREIDKTPQPDSDAIAPQLRRMLGLTGSVAQRLLFSPRRRSKEFPRSAAEEPRNNYKGETPTIDLDAWRLTLDGMDSGTKTLTIDDIKALGRVEQTTELHCVEGWSTIVTWAGARFIDFAKKYPPPPGTRYVSLLSEPADFPDERYYVGLDLASCLHPQSLLAFEMNGETLTPEHGAPLRLVMPHKYGIKNIKLITTIAYSRTPPADYWAEQGYDYYAGL